jgi:hypothetical protein
MVARITTVLRASVLGYLQSDNADDKLLYFNKLVNICTANTVKLFLPVRSVGFGESKDKVLKDNPIRDLAEVFVLETLAHWAQLYLDLSGASRQGKFDFLGYAFKRRVFNEIRKINRSKEEIWIESLPDENKYFDDEQ